MSKRKDDRVNIQTPPIVWGDPSESYRWAVASAEAKKKSKRWKHRQPETVDSPRIAIFLDTKKRMVRKGLSRLIGKGWIEDSIEVRQSVEIVLRGLAFAKFKNVVNLVLDGQQVYSAPDERKDVHHVIDLFHEEFADAEFDEATIESALYGKKSSHVHISVRNRYRSDESPILIKFDGEIELRQLNSFSNYLEKHLDILDEEGR